MSYKSVSPKDFTKEQKEFVESLREPCFKNKLSKVMTHNGFVIKDIHSRYIMSTDYWAISCGLAKGEDFIDILDKDLPCKVAEFAQDFVDEEEKLLSHQDEHRTSSMLNIHEYATGLASFRADKHLLTHEPSQAILGIVGVAYKANLSYFFTLLPNYLREFGANGNIESVNSASEIEGVLLTEYEHEVAFLMTMNWSYKQIANFMDKYRPRAVPRTPDTIYKCRDRVRDKLDCESWQLRDKLIEIGLHRKMPSSFFDRLIGLGNTSIPS